VIGRAHGRIGMHWIGVKVLVFSCAHLQHFFESCRRMIMFFFGFGPKRLLSTLACALVHAGYFEIGKFSDVELCFIALRGPENFSPSPASPKVSRRWKEGLDNEWMERQALALQFRLVIVIPPYSSKTIFSTFFSKGSER